MRKASPSPDPKDKNKEVHYDNSRGLEKSAIHLGQVDFPCMQVTFPSHLPNKQGRSEAVWHFSSKTSDFPRSSKI